MYTHCDFDCTCFASQFYSSHQHKFGLQAKLQQLARTVRSSGSNAPMVQSTLVIVFRDVMAPIESNLPRFRDIYLKNLRSTFERATKPKELRSPTFDECFQVSLIVTTAYLYSQVLVDVNKK